MKKRAPDLFNHLKPITKKIYTSKKIYDVALTKNQWVFLGSVISDHECKGSLMRCCNVFRCELCHLTHMHNAHSEVATQTFERLHESSNIIQREMKVEKAPTAPKVKRVVHKVTDQDTFYKMVSAAIMKASQEELVRFVEKVMQTQQQRSK